MEQAQINKDEAVVVKIERSETLIFYPQLSVIYSWNYQQARVLFI